MLIGQALRKIVAAMVVRAFFERHIPPLHLQSSEVCEFVVHGS